MYVFSGEIKSINLYFVVHRYKKKVFEFLNLGSSRVRLSALDKILNRTLKTIELFTKKNPHFHR